MGCSAGCARILGFEDTTAIDAGLIASDAQRGSDAELTVDGRLSGERFVFVTENVYTGALGGLAGADAKCQSEAQEAARAGDWLAWLADSQTSPGQRFVRSTGPYQLFSETTVADNWEELVSGTLQAPVNVTATGNPRMDVQVWTNVNSAGEPAETVPPCSDWSQSLDGAAHVGLTDTSDSEWTDRGTSPCRQAAALYCFQK